jgi:hypothetical protein
MPPKAGRPAMRWWPRCSPPCGSSIPDGRGP